MARVFGSCLKMRLAAFIGAIGGVISAQWWWWVERRIAVQ